MKTGQIISRHHVVVCRGPNCSFLGSDELLAWCEELAAAGIGIHFEVCGCTGNCEESPVVTWNGRYLTRVSPETLTARLIEEDEL